MRKRLHLIINFNDHELKLVAIYDYNLRSENKTNNLNKHK